MSCAVILKITGVIRRTVVTLSKSAEDTAVKIARETSNLTGSAFTFLADNIAKYLNISQGLCYRYFKSKAEIFTATAEFYAQQILIQIRQPFPENMKAIDKFNITIKRLFQYIIKHGEFEANSEVSALRADRLDSISRQIIEVIIPIIKQGNEEKIFNCYDIEKTTKIFIFGLVHTFHEEMPKQNIKNYIKSFLKYLKINLVLILNIKEPELLGEGWENIL